MDIKSQVIFTIFHFKEDRSPVTITFCIFGYGILEWDIFREPCTIKSVQFLTETTALETHFINLYRTGEDNENNDSRKKVGQKLVTRQKENPGAFEK